jgi:hypothetical protein
VTRLLITLTGLLLSLSVAAQWPETDIFVADLTVTRDSLRVGIPENITARPGYDNQPCFAPNGGSVYFVSDVHGQTDVMRYLFVNKKTATITRTRESEFSPTLSPDGRTITVVRIDTDSVQRAYTFPYSSSRFPTVLFNSDSIGYFCWISDSLLAMFIVSNPPALQLLRTTNAARKTVATGIGRCLKLSADGKTLYFVRKFSSTDWKIQSLHVANGQIRTVAPTLKGEEDFAVLKNGTLLMGSAGKLYARTPKRKKWKMEADFSKTVGPFYRIAVSPGEDRIAVVAYSGQKP